MIGCFGNNIFDRIAEHQLMQYLDEESAFYCEDCEYECSIEDCEYDDEKDLIQCPKCKKWKLP